MGSTFSADWLDLREPLDAAARAGELTADLAELIHRAHRRERVLQVIDLGAGTGAQLRYAAPLLGARQHWLLVERDPLLLDALRLRLRAWAPQFECRVDVLALDLAGDLDRLPLPDEALLSAAALLDLVSESWLETLARRVARAAATVWFTLSFDGRIQCSPAEPEDEEVFELFRAHQRTDKGFGAALGASAAQRAEEIFAGHGYRIRSAPSDWRLGPAQRALQHALLEGWLAAACAIAPERAVALQGWRARRRALIEQGRSRLQVGHIDLIGYPRGA